jgi:hypothetical protein
MAIKLADKEIIFCGLIGKCVEAYALASGHFETLDP